MIVLKLLSIINIFNSIKFSTNNKAAVYQLINQTFKADLYVLEITKKGDAKTPLKKVKDLRISSTADSNCNGLSFSTHGKSKSMNYKE